MLATTARALQENNAHGLGGGETRARSAAHAPPQPPAHARNSRPRTTTPAPTYACSEPPAPSSPQIYEGDLFDFELEVEPILEVSPATKTAASPYFKAIRPPIFPSRTCHAQDCNAQDCNVVPCCSRPAFPSSPSPPPSPVLQSIYTSTFP